MFIGILGSLWGYELTLMVQPHTEVLCYADGEPAVYTRVRTDNSLGTIRCTVPDGTKTIGVFCAGFKGVYLDAEAARRDIPLVILDKLYTSYACTAVAAVGDQPKSVTFIDPLRVAVPLLNGTGVDIVNIKTGKAVRICPPGKYAEKRGFVESLVLPQKNELWVSQMTTACIHVFSLSDLRYKTTIQSSGQWGKVLAYNPTSNLVYFTNWITQDLSIIDPRTYTEIRRVKTGAVPRGMVFSKDGRYLYLAQFEVNGKSRGQVVKVDTKTLKATARFGKKGAKRHIVLNADGTRLYVSDMAHAIIEVFSTADNTLIAEISVGDKPNTIALSPDGTLLYVSCRGPNNPQKGYLHKGLEMGKIYVIDTAALTVQEFWEGGNQPTGLDISPDGQTLVFSDFLDKRLRIYKKITPTETLLSDDNK